jgi:hypothetical protein
MQRRIGCRLSRIVDPEKAMDTGLRTSIFFPPKPIYYMRFPAKLFQNPYYRGECAPNRPPTKTRSDTAATEMGKATVRG